MNKFLQHFTITLIVSIAAFVVTMEFSKRKFHDFGHDTDAFVCDYCRHTGSFIDSKNRIVCSKCKHAYDPSAFGKTVYAYNVFTTNAFRELLSVFTQ